jgi:hypothetical protein
MYPDYRKWKGVRGREARLKERLKGVAKPTITTREKHLLAKKRSIKNSIRSHSNPFHDTFSFNSFFNLSNKKNW